MVKRKAKGLGAFGQHGAIHLLVLIVCVAVFLGTQVLRSHQTWIVFTLYIAAHLLIDWSKQQLVKSGKSADSARLFVLDQALHLVTIVIVAWAVVRPAWGALSAEFRWSAATGERALEASIVYVTVVFAGGYAIRYLTRSLAAGTQHPGETAQQLENAGMYIGWLERALVITAVLVQSPSLVGLILTGKSIARFPELKERFAEYFLIGSFLSVGMALVGGLVLLKLWYGTMSLK